MGMEGFAYFILQLFAHHHITVAFIAGLLMEEVVLLLSFFSAHSSIPLVLIIAVSPLGILITDSLFFFIGKTGIIQHIRKEITFLNDYTKIPPLIAKFQSKHPLLTLIGTKFVVGTRIPMTLYFSIKGMKYRRYVLYDLIAVYAWAVVIVPLGWLAGLGFTRGLHIAKDFSTIAGIAILFCFAWYLASRMIKHKIWYHLAKAFD